MSLRVGVVGLGVMGSAIARRLLDQLGTVAVHDVRAQARATLAAQGAVEHHSAASLAAACDVVLLSLNTVDVVESVLLGPDGLAHSNPAHSGPAHSGPAQGDPTQSDPAQSDPQRQLLVVDMSSIDPAATRRLAAAAAESGVAWVDAPLSGGAPGAAAGRLTLMVGGEAADVERARPVLAHLAARVTHLGPSGSGQLVKLVNQVLVGTAFSAIAEAAALVRSEGLDPGLVLSALSGGRADSALLQEFFVKFAEGDLTPTGRVANMVKDLDGAREHARGIGLPLPVTTQVGELNRWLLARGLGDADNAALMGYYDPTVLDDRAVPRAALEEKA